MIRVGFILSLDDSSWTGGLVYFKSLLQALNDWGSSDLQAVLLLPPGTEDQRFTRLPRIEIAHAHGVQTQDWRWRVSKGMQRLLGRDPYIENVLRQHGIDVLSHSGHLGARGRIPTLGWIPDFQHRHLPQFFSAAERSQRDARFARLIEWCSAVIVSSEHTRQDLMAFTPQWARKARVLRVVSDVPAPEQLTDLATLQKRYDFKGPYFHLPNQFWAHKDHRVVIDALAELRHRGRHAQVLATGNTQDKRQPAFFEQLMAHAHALGLETHFRVLGLVPYDDMLALMHHSLALINPSLFEGWGTSAELSKSSGQRVILSNIPVHLEQNPPQAVYFKTTDPRSLADALSQVMDSTDPTAQAAARLQAYQAVPRRRQQLASDYEAIVRSVLPTRASRTTGTRRAVTL